MGKYIKGFSAIMILVSGSVLGVTDSFPAAQPLTLRESFKEYFPISTWDDVLQRPVEISFFDDAFSLKPLDTSADSSINRMLISILTDPRQVFSFANGKAFVQSEVLGLIARSSQRWDCGDITSHWIIYSNDTPLGLICVNGDKDQPSVPGITEVSYIVGISTRGTGVSKVIIEFLTGYLDFLFQAKVLIGGVPFKGAKATVNLDNFAYQKILDKSGFITTPRISKEEVLQMFKIESCDLTLMDRNPSEPEGLVLVLPNYLKPKMLFVRIGGRTLNTEISKL